MTRKRMKPMRGYAIVNSLGRMCGLVYERKSLLLHLNDLGEHERVVSVEVREVVRKRRMPRGK